MSDHISTERVDGRSAVFCTICGYGVHRTEWMISDKTWFGFRDTFLRDHEGNHRPKEKPGARHHDSIRRQK